MKYVAPEFKKKSFTCPHCDVYAHFRWIEARESIQFGGINAHKGSDLHIGYCSHCEGRIVWLVNEPNSYMLFPIGVTNAPVPHEEMPEDVKIDYLEAKNICTLSPRGAAALLRLSIQKLCKHLGESGDNINADIGALVKKGLPVQIQRALDVVRVTGNNAVHPGELVLDDKPEVVTALFDLVNLIIDDRIAEPKRIDELYSNLPSSAISGIEKRDK